MLLYSDASSEKNYCQLILISIVCLLSPLLKQQTCILPQVGGFKLVIDRVVCNRLSDKRRYNLHEVTHSRFNRVVQHNVWEDYLSLNGKISHFLSFLIVYSHFSLNAASVLVDAFDWLLLLILTLLRAFYILLVLLTLKCCSLVVLYPFC